MTTEERKVQLEVEVGASGARKGFDDVKAGARDMAQSVAQAGQQAAKGVDAIGQGADTSAQAVDKSASRIAAALKRSTSELQRANAELEAGGKNTAKYWEALARDRGVNLGTIDPAVLAQWEAAAARNRDLAASMSKTGVSAGQMQAAMRGLPAQITDIVVSLQSGQKPMTILFQQGGQLKDMFGGLGPAARALGGYVAGLVNPFTLAAAGAAVLSLAYHEGSKEADAYRNAIILSGNAAGVSIGKMQALAETVSAVSGVTKGTAAGALTQIVAGGTVATENLQRVAAAAVIMERATGTAIAETVKQFEELGKSPADASLKLNERANYLTAAIYKQIKALEDQGKVTEAAALAQRTYADALGERSIKIIESLGSIEKAWKTIGQTAKSAWDFMLDVGRPLTLEDKIKAAEAALANARAGFRGKDRIPDLEEALRALKAQQEAEQKTAKAAGEAAEKEKARIEWIKEGDKYLSKRVEMERELSRLSTQAKAAGVRLDSKEYLDRLKEVKKKYDSIYAESDQLIKADFSQRLDAIKQELGAEELALNAARERNLIGERDYVSQLQALRVDAATRQLEALSAQYAKTRKPVDREAVVHDMQKAAGDIAKAMSESEVAFARLAQKGNEALGKLAGDLNKNALDPLSQAAAEFSARYGKLVQDIAAANQLDAASPMLTELWQRLADEKRFDRAKKLYDELFAEMTAGIEAVRLAAQQSGGLLSDLGNDAQVKAVIEQYRARIDALRRDMATYANNDPARLKAVAEADRAVNKTLADADRNLQKFMDDVQRGLTDSIYRGLEKGGQDGARVARDAIVNTLKAIPIKLFVQAVVDPIMGAARSAIGGAVSGGLNLASAGGNAYSLIGGNGAMPGWYGSFANSGLGQTLGLSQQVEMFSEVSGLTESATVLTDAGVALGNAVPYVAAAAAALAVVSNIFGQNGGPKGGGDAGYTLAGNRWTATPDNMPGDTYRNLYTPASANAQVEQMLSSVLVAIPSLVERLGGHLTGVRASLGFDTDPQGTASNRVSSIVNNTPLSINRDFGRDEAALRQGMADELNRITLQILKDADLESWAEAITNAIDPATASAQQLAEALAKLDGMAKVVPLFEAVGVGADKVSESLVAALGGFDATANALDRYYQNFYTDAERRQRLAEQVGSAFAALGVAEPATRAGFRALVESLDLTTESGQHTYAGLMRVQDAFAQLTDSADQTAQAAQRAAEESARAASQAAATAARSALDSLDRAVDTESKRLQTAAAARVSGLEAQRDAQLEAIDAAIAGYRTQAEAARDLQRELLDVFRSLSEAAAEMGGGLSVAQGAARLAEMLAQARTVGAMPDGTALAPVLGAVRAIRAEDYATSAEYQRERARIATDLRGLADIAAAQTANAANTVTTLDELVKTQESARKDAERGWRDQIKAVEDAADVQVDALTALRDTAREQLNALEGNATAIQSVAAAVTGFNASIQALAQNLGKPVPNVMSPPAVARTSPGGGSYSVATDTWTTLSGVSATSAQLRDEVARAVSAVGIDATVLQVYSATKGGGFAMADVNAALNLPAGTFEDLARQKGLPAFEGGGFHAGGLRLVGERGPEIEATGAARIWSFEDTRRMLGGDASTAAEIRSLRAENKQLSQQLAQILERIAGNTKDTAGHVAVLGEGPLLVEVDS